MGILLTENTRVIVQGITGRAASMHTEVMLKYGTKIVAGVSPGKRGILWKDRLPVYDLVADARKDTDANCVLSFVPAASAKEAIFESIDCGIELVVIVTEGIPIHHMLEVHRKLKDSKTELIGPSTPGIISPGIAKVGFIPERSCRQGGIGVISRSGTLAYELCYRLVEAGMGQSTWVGIGGDAIKGLTICDVLDKFKNDPQTEAVLIIGEIGGSDEELAAEYIRAGYNKKVVAYIAGRNVPEGKQMGHAGAIVSGGSGGYAAKVQKLREAGVSVAKGLDEVVDLFGKLL